MPSRETDITSIKSNLNKVVNLQNVQIVTDSTFLLCRARDETRKAKANCPKETSLCERYPCFGFCRVGNRVDVRSTDAVDH